MKKNVIKTAVAAVCVVAAGVSGMKAYNVANQSQADMLLAENVDAFSAGDSGDSGDGGDSGGSTKTNRAWLPTGQGGQTTTGLVYTIDVCSYLKGANDNCTIGETRMNFS